MKSSLFFLSEADEAKKTKQTLCTQRRLQDFHETYFNDMIEMGFLKESNQLLLIKTSLIK